MKRRLRIIWRSRWLKPPASCPMRRNPLCRRSSRLYPCRQIVLPQTRSNSLPRNLRLVCGDYFAGTKSLAPTSFTATSVKKRRNGLSLYVPRWSSEMRIGQAILCGSLHPRKHFSRVDILPFLDEQAFDFPAFGRTDFILHFHGFDNQQALARF